MNISNNKVVSLSYQLRLDGKDGKVIETVDAARPLMFIFGTDSLIPGFERNINNLKTGDSFAFQLDCEDAYGPAIEENLMEIPKTVFASDGEIDHDILFEGNMITMIDQEGNHRNAIVDTVKDDTVIMDFNHPLAGDTLYFSGTVVNVREATIEELKNGLAGAGCSSGSCEGCNGGCN